MIKYTNEKKWVVASLLINAKMYSAYVEKAKCSILLVFVESSCSRLKCKASYLRYYHFVSVHSVLGTVKFAIFADEIGMVLAWQKKNAAHVLNNGKLFCTLNSIK